jgi:hypothetical protein
MNKTKWDRWAPFSGIAFIGVIVVTFFLPPKSPPTVADSAAEWASHLQDHRTALLISSYLTGIAMVFFLFFLGSLVSRLRGAGEMRLATVALGGGLVTAGIWVGWMSLEASLTWDLVNDVQAGDVKVLLGTADFGFPIPLATLVGATSIAAWRSRIWPTWLSLIGIFSALWIVVGGAALMRNGFFSPHGGYRLVGFLLFFVWMLLAAIFMLVRPTEEESQVAAPTTA